MKCWICGGEGNTGEHLVKKSDLKAIFPNVSQKKPLFFSANYKRCNGEVIRNGKVGSVEDKKSLYLKSKALICQDCNSNRTSPHDKAWEKLSRHLREKNPPIKKGEIVKLNKVFPGAVKKSMLDVHLFFIKLFGCAIVEHNVRIDITNFSEAIMNQKPHPLVYLAILPSLDVGIKNYAGRTNMRIASTIDGKCMYATWFYRVGSLSVRVIYAEPTECRKGMVHTWHPTTITKCLHVSA
jgi:hypothetical protein